MSNSIWSKDADIGLVKLVRADFYSAPSLNYRLYRIIWRGQTDKRIFILMVVLINQNDYYN